MIIAAPGSRSEGLRMREFPVAIAIGRDQRGIIAGKLNLVAYFQFDQQALQTTWRGAQRSDEDDELKESAYGQMAAPTPRGTRRV